MTTRFTLFENIDEALAYDGPTTGLPLDVEHSAQRNRVRAYRAAVALKAYIDFYGDQDDLASHICDLLTDLRHLASQSLGEDGEPIDEDAFLTLVERSRDRWDEEAFGSE